MPHAHILIILAPEDKIKSTEEVDAIVCAQIPDQQLHPKAYETVKNCMMHGPCGPAFPYEPCMKKDAAGILKCSKGFPKAYQESTSFANES